MMQNVPRYLYCRSCGFTLLEVLIALAITTFIVSAFYGTFFLSHRAIASLEGSLIRLQEARSAIDNLKRELESAYYQSYNQHTLFKLEDRDFYGRAVSRITFTAFSPLMAGLVKISYNVEENDGRLTLKKTLSSAFLQNPPQKNIEIIEEIHSFSVEVKYRGKWVKTWDSKTTHGLPEEVRISITFLDKVRDDKNQTKDNVTVFDTARLIIGKTSSL